MKILLLIVINLVLESKTQNLELNSPCELNLNKKQGYCKQISECPRVQKDWEQFKYPLTICFFDDRFTPVVCCPNDFSSTETPLSFNSLNENPNAALLKRRIIDQKCDEYYPPKPFFINPVVGGENALAFEFPFVAAIGWKRFDGNFNYHCGGFLITQNHVITAAHCTSSGGSPPDIVLIGGSNLDSSPELDNLFQVVSIHNHPQYNPANFYHDVAILELDRNATQVPACLYTKNDTVTKVVAIGYGHTEFGGKYSNILQKVFLKVIGNAVCEQFYQNDKDESSSALKNGIINEQICAGDPDGIRDTCQGDSGGPILIKLVENNNLISYIIGITSFGQGCATGVPSVYTYLPSYFDWIESILWPDN